MFVHIPVTIKCSKCGSEQYETFYKVISPIASESGKRCLNLSCRHESVDARITVSETDPVQYSVANNQVETF